MATNEGINYEAVLADLEARRDQLEAAIAAIRAVAGMGPVGSAASGGTQINMPTISHDTFFGMSIPEATKKLLGILKRRLSTPEAIKYLTQGGVPEPAYNTAYAVLRRRQNQIGDIVNVNGEWSLKEWVPGYRPSTRTKKSDADKDGPSEGSTEIRANSAKASEPSEATDTRK
ncbi:MAG TPA: hypothetical protein VKZ53_02965 [Candidatus Angelobacter sp.]|nr:hypothetical protein [Candidatus Angelobacter sp.]